MISAVAVPSQARPGTRTLGRYELIANIGTGGMAEVHLARQRGPMGFEKLVVVKTVHGHLAAQRDFIEMLLEEARIAALVKHANVVDIYDLGVVDGAYFIAMEYLEGEPLLAILRAGKGGKRLDSLSTIRLIADCAEGLHAAHELHAMSGQPLSVVHHDVSPGNVMVLYSGEVKLVDFGVAKAENKVEQAGERVLMKGKMSYMAPEKLRGASGDRRSDVFSLGVVLWEAMTLRRLFRADSDKEVARMIIESAVPPPSTLDPTAPPEIDAIVAKAVAKDAEQRYPTAKAMAAALEEFLRKQGYSGKNDKIGEYMHATFGDRLATRRDLIRRMSGSGVAPSAQAIAHAFRQDTSMPIPLSSTTPPSMPKPPLPPPKRAPAQGTAKASTQQARPQTEELSTFTEVEAYRAPPDPLAEEPSVVKQWLVDDAGTVLDENAAAKVAALEAIRHGEFQAKEVEPTPRPVVPPARRDAVVIGGLIGLGLVVAIVGFVLTRGGDDDETTPAPAKVAAGAAVGGAGAGAGEPPEIDMVGTGDTQPGGPVIGDLGGPTRPGTKPDKPTPSREDRDDKRSGRDDRDRDDKRRDGKSDKANKADKADGAKADGTKAEADGTKPDPESAAEPTTAPSGSSANALVKEGAKHFVAGKLKEALASFEMAKHRAPGYAPAYRGIGMVKQRMGDRSGAAAAYRKYLALAPKAGDAASIRTKLEKLEQ
jgi:serine/threonine-protein kinase